MQNRSAVRRQYPVIGSTATGGFFLVLVAVSPALQAAPPATPPSAPVIQAPTPGQVQSNLPTTPPPPQFKAVPLTQLPAPVSGTVPPGGPTVQVQKFVLTGNTVYGDEVLQPLLKGFLGRELTLAEIYSAADTLTKYYQAQGYGLARAAVPQQEMTNGSVILQVIEGRIGKVDVQGATRTRAAVIQKQAAALQGGQVYTDAAMDRSIMLANDLPAVQAQAVLEPGSEFGTADLTYKVTETPEVSGLVSVDDYGRRDVGLWRLNAEADVNSLTGSGDKLSADVTHTDHNLLNFGGLTYSLPLGPAGGRLTTAYNQSEYEVKGETFSALQISGTSKNGTLSYLYPEERGRLQNWYVGAGLQHEGSTSSADGKPVTATDLNYLQLTSYYNSSTDAGRSFSLNTTFSTNGRRDNGVTPSGQAARLELDSSYYTPLDTGMQWAFVGQAAGEWSPDPLSDTEKYSLGGADNVRGFLSAERRGDSGLFASAELQRALPFTPRLALGAFVDSGKVWTKAFTVPYPTCKAKPDKLNAAPCFSPGTAVTLTSVGTEIQLLPTQDGWSARLQLAWAVGGYRPSDDTAASYDIHGHHSDRGPHIWFTVAKTF